MLAAKPSIGAPVATVKQGRPRRKLEKRVMSVIEPVPTPIIRSASRGSRITISPSVASSKPRCSSVWHTQSMPASRSRHSQRSPATRRVIGSHRRKGLR